MTDFQQTCVAFQFVLKGLADRAAKLPILRFHNGESYGELSVLRVFSLVVVR